MPEGALVCYGRGGGLGNFKFFADDLVRLTLKPKYGDNIQSHSTERRATLIEKIEKCPFSIKELHIFAHSIGGGLFLAYGDSYAYSLRDAVLAKNDKPGGKATYEDAVNAEVGSVLTDHLILSPLAGKREALRKKFATGATIKIWGCNSGVKDWIYDTESPYWNLLNLKNSPKPAVAQALADFFKVETIGAKSGANIQVYYKGKWIYADKYKTLTGRYAGEPEVLRLNPTKGGYVSFKPTGS